MKILISLTLFIIFGFPSFSQQKILIFGDISNCFTLEGIPHARVELTDKDGKCIAQDSSRLIVRKEVYENSVSFYQDKKSGAQFKLYIAKPQDCRLFIVANGYLPYSQEIKAESLRKSNFDAGSIYLHPEPKHYNLDEVTVKATKVKMVYNGDTIVYNADAFNISQSESLRKLIEQMPGTEFVDGRIYVNGRYVENLLLNGKNFFNGNIAAALDNLPAYIVDKVKLYDKSGELSELTGKDMHDSEYVMDIKLKREYTGTWLVQTEAGIGTHGRKSLLAYVMRVDDRQMFSFHSDINNLNEKRQQTEIARMIDRIPDGERMYKSANISYYIQPGKSFRFRSNLDVSRSDDDIATRKNQERWMTPINIMQRNVHRTDNTETYINAFGAVTLYPRRHQRYEASYNFKYNDIEYFNVNKDVSYFATDNNEWDNMSVDSIFDLDNMEQSNLLYTLMNPGKGDERSTTHNASALATYAIGDNIINVKAILNNNSEKDKDWEIYQLRYTQDEAQNEGRHRYNRRNNSMTTLDVNSEFILKYIDTERNNGQVIPYLQYRHIDGTESHPEYRLDRIEGWLEDLKGLDIVPSQELLALCIDNENSYHSWIKNDILSCGMKISHKGMLANDRHYKIEATADISYNSHSLDYEREKQMHKAKREEIFLLPHVAFEWYPCRNDENGSISRWQLKYEGTPSMPEMTWLLPLRDSHDPLNIFLGNANLKNEYTHDVGLSYNYNWKKSTRSFAWSANWQHTDNDIVTVSVYDRLTGKRTYSLVNTSKTHSAQSRITFSTALDSDRKIYLTTAVQGGYSQYSGRPTSDGDNTQGNELIKNSHITPKITLRCTLSNSLRAYISCSTRYNNINSGEYKDDYYRTDVNADITWKMPWGLELSSNLNLKDYKGYSSEELNKTFPVWNATLTQYFLKNRLSVKIVAHDILAREKSVKTTIDNEGRYDSWSNHLQRYVTLHIGYRINWSEKSKSKQ